MTKTQVSGWVEGGVLHLANRKRLNEDLRRFPACDVQVIIRKKGKRSSAQNRYYFGIIVEEIRIRLRELGHEVDADTVHEYLKGRFNFERVVVEATGEALDIARSTANLSKDEFSEYLDRVRQWAAEGLGIAIPDPNTQTELFTQTQHQ